MDRDALIAHFALLGWEPIRVVRFGIHDCAILDREHARVLYIDQDPKSRHFGNVVRVSAALTMLIVRDPRCGWGEIADHHLREFYRVAGA